MGVCGEWRGREKSLLCGPALNVPVSDSSHMFSLWLFKESCALVCVIWKHPLFLVPYNRTSEANGAGVGSPWQSSVRVDAQRLINKESLRAILDPCHTGPSSSDHEPEKSGRWGVCVCVLHWIMYVYNRWVCNRCVTTDFCIFKWHRPTLVAHTQGFYSFPVLYPLAGWVGAASTLFVSP